MILLQGPFRASLLLVYISEFQRLVMLILRNNNIPAGKVNWNQLFFSLSRSLWEELLNFLSNLDVTSSLKSPTYVDFCDISFVFSLPASLFDTIVLGVLSTKNCSSFACIHQNSLSCYVKWYKDTAILGCSTVW